MDYNKYIGYDFSKITPEEYYKLKKNIINDVKANKNIDKSSPISQVIHDLCCNIKDVSCVNDPVKELTEILVLVD